jgi:hypothetical protein
MAFVLANIEIILSAVGLLVIVLVPALVDPKQENFLGSDSDHCPFSWTHTRVHFLAGSQKAAYTTSTAPQ